MPVIYKSQTNHFVLHTLLARAHILVTCLVAFATTVAFFFCTPLLATILSCRSLPNWPGIQHHHSHRHRKVRLSLMWNNPCLLLCQGSNPNLLVCCQNTIELLHLAQIQSWLRILMARWFFSLQEDEEQDVEAVRKRNQKVISTLAVYFSSILLLVVWMVLGHTFSGDSSTFLAQNGRTP